MTVLPDYLAPGLRIVFCGTAVSTASAERGHYYAGPGNEFWSFLHRSGLTPVLLSPEEDSRVLEFGLGLTDLAKKTAASSDAGLDPHYDINGFVERIERAAPRWLAFHGKTAARAASKALGQGSAVALGKQSWTIGETPVFVVPSASAANRDPKRLEGRSNRVDWFRELATTTGDLRLPGARRLDRSTYVDDQLPPAHRCRRQGRRPRDL
ncbi:MAG: mismatch-specific DNA-glycosylase [Actinomycetota bacterium]|jgi:TDG/mug DNA glycosylase family protein|nr:mismatch-specific DNA-glycosylase [Actinomycetota bacterium]